jgi:hypothetical protein
VAHRGVYGGIGAVLPDLSIGTQKGPPIGMEKGPRFGLVQVANRRDPRVTGSFPHEQRNGARGRFACLPTWASWGNGQARFLKRQLSLPVSMISQ